MATVGRGGAILVMAAATPPPASPGSSGALSRSRSNTNSATELGENGAQFQVPPSTAAASEASDGAPASVDAVVPASAAPASVQGEGAGGAGGGGLATQRHQLLALVWRQITTAGSHIPPLML